MKATIRNLAVGTVLAALMAGFAPQTANAHSTSTSYLVADSTSDGTNDVRITWAASAAGMDWALGLDNDGDGLVTWGEIDGRREEIAAFVAGHLDVARGGSRCDVRFIDLQLARYADAPHLSLSYRAACHRSGALGLVADVFFDTDSTQRTFVDISTPAGQFTSVLSPQSRRWIEPAAPSALATFTTFIGQGLWHVWIGYDHLVFLILLLLPGVLRSTGTQWRAVGTFRDTAVDIIRVVTAFTFAHSVTLALAATGAVSVPVRLVEIAIAASIVVAGVLNLFPAAARVRLALAFGFGLIHGFGFANALAELGTGSARLVPTLAGFNVGVELAQLSLVALVLPVLWQARKSAFYAWRFMPATSVVAALAGVAWLVARTG